MKEKALNLSLTDSEGHAKPLRDWIQESPFTGLLTYRGDW